MQIDWWTLALQAVNFLVLVWLLSRFLFRPVREVIEKRRKLAEQAFAEADKRQSAADAALHQYEEDRAALAEERQNLLSQIRKEQEAEAQKILDDARSKSDQLLAEAKKSISRERDAAVAEVKKQVAGLAVEMAARLLDEIGSPASNGRVADSLVERLGNMPEDEQKRLQKDLSANGARLTVATASPLAADEQRQWIERFDAYLGDGHKTEFVVDPDIVGGAELRFPHAMLKLTWADYLRRMEGLLQENERTE